MQRELFQPTLWRVIMFRV